MSIKIIATAAGLAFAGQAEAFSAPSAVRPTLARSAVATRSEVQASSVFETAQSSFAADFPDFYSRGFGPTTKAERWNGRHAMFGWVAIIATGYATSHGLIPDFDKPLDLAAWGTLAKQGDYTAITNGRAIILIAHVHALFVSLASALAPFGFADSLTLNMKAGEKDESAYGVIVPLKETGLSASAEMANGRMAMLGLVVTVAYSLGTQTPFMDVVNLGVGGLLMPQ